MHPHTKLPSETPLFRLSFQDMQSIHYENYTQLAEGSASTKYLLLKPGPLALEVLQVHGGKSYSRCPSCPTLTKRASLSTPSTSFPRS